MSDDDSENLINSDTTEPIIEVGKILKDARLEQGKSLSDVARSLSIRKPYIQAIEQGKLVSLPGNTYTYGFIRSYASYLKLDPAILIKKLESKEENSVSTPPSLIMNLPPPEMKLPSSLIILSSILSVVIAYIVWMYYISSGSIYYNIPNISEIASITDKKNIIVSQPSKLANEDNNELKVNDIIEKNSEQILDKPVPLVEPKPVHNEYGEIGGRITLYATMETWIQIQNESRAAIETRILHKGDRYYLSGEDVTYLMTSNIGGLNITVDGLSIPPMGSIGELKRDIRLNPNSLLNMR